MDADPSAAHILLSASQHIRAASASKDSAPHSEILPLTHLQQPVTLVCGHNFEFAPFQAHLQAGSRQCPLCGTAVGIEPENLRVNVEVQQMLGQLRALQHQAQRIQHPLQTACAQPQCSHSNATADAATGATVNRTNAVRAAPLQVTAAAQACSDAAAAAAVLAGVASATSTASHPTLAADPDGDDGECSADEDEYGGLVDDDYAQATWATTSPRSRLPITSPFGRDSPQVEAFMAACYARQLTSVMTKNTGDTLGELPISLTKRVMKQDAVNVQLRMVSAEAVDLMAFANELFIGFVTDLAWQVSTVPGKRVTVDLRDLQHAIASTSKLDFLVEISLGCEFQPPNIAALDAKANSRQRARLRARREERAQALGKGKLAQRAHASRRLHAMKRQRGLGGRFLGRAEEDAVSMLVGTHVGDGSSILGRVDSMSETGGMLFESSSSPVASQSSPVQGVPTRSISPAAMAAAPALTLSRVASDPGPSTQARPPTVWAVAGSPLGALAAGPVVAVATGNLHPGWPQQGALLEHRMSHLSERDRSMFPLANVTRVMNQNLPTGTKISKDAKECMCEMAVEMTAFVSMEASMLAVQESSRAISSDCLMDAFKNLDLGALVPAMQVWLRSRTSSKCEQMADETATAYANAAAALLFNEVEDDAGRPEPIDES